MKVLITGNMGYVGPVLIDLLKKKKFFQIFGVDNFYFSKVKKKNQYFTDIRDLKSDFIKRFDAIVNLAAVSNDPMGKKFKNATRSINLDASKKILDLCIKNQVKIFVFASSCSIYGFGGNKYKTENDKLNPLTDYAKSKIGFEKYAKNKKLNKTKVTCLRFGTAMGSSKNMRLDLVLNDLVGKAIVYNNIKMISDGTPLRPLIHVKDMSRAILWALEDRNKLEQKFLTINVGKNNMNFRIRDIAKRVKKHIRTADIEFGKVTTPDKRSYKVNFDKFKKLAPNHQPIFDLDKSIKDITQHLKKIGKKKLKKTYKNYFRLKILQDHLNNKKISNNLRWIKKSENTK